MSDFGARNKPSEVERKAWNDRGFVSYGSEPIVCGYGSEVSVSESSAAEESFMWLRMVGWDAPPDSSSLWGLHPDRPYKAAAHLDRSMVVELVARLQAWLDDHPAEVES